MCFIRYYELKELSQSIQWEEGKCWVHLSPNFLIHSSFRKQLSDPIIVHCTASQKTKDANLFRRDLWEPEIFHQVRGFA